VASGGRIGYASGVMPDSPSRWSIRSERSLLCIASTGSVLSIGSVGSVCSVGSIGSACSLWSLGSFASVGSALSARSRWSLLSDRSYDAVQGSRDAHTRALGLRATQILALAAAAALAGRRLEGCRRRRG
jgi:hypothetical protein